ncbi:4'-phosphopantetheinyl transferase [bacterium A37T11]|nr:4'-phosphopantetheinyl transferase [bacterium A37T11]
MNLECIPLKKIKWQPYQPDLSVSLHDCNIWLMNVDAYTPTLSNFEHLLTVEEQQKAAKYTKISDQIRFKLGRVMLRILLARFLHTPPYKVPIVIGAFQKPELNHPYKEKLHFNISHSNSRIVIAISAFPVGIDIEYISFQNHLEEMFQIVLNSEEAAFVGRAPSVSEAFYLLWTRKEALLKALGTGLIDDLSKVPSLDGRHSANLDNLSEMQADQCLISTIRHNYLLSTCYAKGISKIVFWDY